MEDSTPITVCITRTVKPGSEAAFERALHEFVQRSLVLPGQSLLPVIQEIRAARVTALRSIAQCLNARGFKTPNGKAFKAQSVKNLLERITAAAAPSEPEANKRNGICIRPKPSKLGMAS